MGPPVQFAVSVLIEFVSRNDLAGSPPTVTSVTGQRVVKPQHQVGRSVTRDGGSVRLRSADPLDAPRIELPKLRDPSDVDRLAEGYRRGIEVANRPEIRRLCGEAATPEALGADEERRVVRETAYSVPHVVGTCAMGTSPDEGAVVDARGRVHGTEALFIVDASIMPDAPSGFPHIVTIMMAERLSEQIAALL